MAAASNEYDPTGVIAAANEKLLAGDLEGGQFVFQSALLQWTDDARESSSISESLREAVATLWLAYAQFLVQAKQFKSATEAYEEATNCSVAGSSGRVYAEYARFAMERQKRKTAQDVYIKALVANGSGAVTDEQDRELLWNDFLEMMRATNPNLTMAALRQAVTEQETTISANNLPPSAKRLKLGDSDDYNNSESAVISSVSTKITTTASAITESKTHVVTAETVEMEAQQQLAEALQPHNAATHNLPPGVMAAWMSRDGHAEPQAPEPPLFAPSPPKLSDPVSQSACLSY